MDPINVCVLGSCGGLKNLLCCKVYYVEVLLSVDFYVLC